MKLLCQNLLAVWGNEAIVSESFGKCLIGIHTLAIYMAIDPLGMQSYNTVKDSYHGNTLHIITLYG